MIDNLEKDLSFLIKKEGLQNLDIYYKKYEDFEEIPLYSRWTHISFLSSFSFNEKNKILIRKGLELINVAVKESTNYLSKSELEEYFICLTVTKWDDVEDINCLCVNVFITRRKGWILSHLKLKQKSSVEEQLIREYLLSLDVEGYDVFVPDSDNEEFKRVYIINKQLLI